MEMRAGFPGQFASILRMHNAGLPRREKSPVMASSHNGLRSVEVAANMRRLSGSRGGGGRQDAPITEKADGPWVNDKDKGTCVTNKKAKGQGVGQKRKDGLPRGVRDKVRRDKVRGDGQTLNGFNCRTGLRDRCYRRHSEYLLAPKCPWRDTPKGDWSPPSQEQGKASQPSYTANLMQTQVSAQKAEHVGSEETKSECEQSFLTKLDVGGLSSVSDDDSVLALDAGATANLVCFCRPERQNRLPEKSGRQKLSP